MSDNKVLKLVYTFFLGLLLAIFVGVGINTFYPAPKAPEMPIEVRVMTEKPSDQDLTQQRAFEAQMAQHEKDLKPYNRNVSIMTLVAAVILMAASLAFEKKIKIMADGVMLGGLFTLVYSLGRGFASEDSKYMFIAVTVGLAVVLYLGYHRFVQGHEHGKVKKSDS